MSVIAAHSGMMVLGKTIYWRIFITSITSGNFASMAEIQFRETPGGPSVAVGGTPSASSFNAAPEMPQYAFDGDINTLWASASGAAVNSWLRYDMPTPVDIREISIQARTGASAGPQTPRSFIVQSSPDGTTWQTVWVVTGIGTWAASQIRVFTRP